jgi:hypothetical protein
MLRPSPPLGHSDLCHSDRSGQHLLAHILVRRFLFLSSRPEQTVFSAARSSVRGLRRGRTVTKLQPKTTRWDKTNKARSVPDPPLERLPAGRLAGQPASLHRHNPQISDSLFIRYNMTPLSVVVPIFTRIQNL